MKGCYLEYGLALTEIGFNKNKKKKENKKNHNIQADNKFYQRHIT